MDWYTTARYKNNNLHYVFIDGVWICAYGVANSGKPVFLSTDDVNPEAPDEIHEVWNPSTHELVKALNCKDFRDTIKLKMKEHKDEIERLAGLRNSLERKAMDEYRNMADQDRYKELLFAFYIEHPTTIHRGHLEQLERVLYNSKQVTGKNGEVDFRKLIDQAKGIPITNFISMNSSGFSKCIFHEDHTPSMKYYKKDNSVHCFSCNKSGDVIDVVRQIKECDFKQAISILTN